MSELVFELTYSVPDLPLRLLAPRVHMSLGGPHRVEVQLQHLDTEFARTSPPPTLHCHATRSVTVDPGILELLRHTVDVIRRTGEAEYDSRARQAVVDGCQAVSQDLLGVLELIPWKLDMEGPSILPLRPEHRWWSVDDSLRIAVPYRMSTRAYSMPSTRPFRQTQADEVAALARRGTKAPLAQPLLLEAWSSRLDRPRSAMVLAAAAAETRAKEAIRRLALAVPSSELARPTETIVRTVRDAAETQINRSLDLRDEVFDRLASGRRARNAMVHGDATVLPSPEDVSEHVKAVRALCLALDLLEQPSWADDHERGFDFYDDMSPGPWYPSASA